ncbi:hypothetical protein LNP25_31770 [Klebsiella variicola subsp. variicola]|nr:hypothetical protein [Klebsiella variicola subsp. variicola]
MNQQDIEQVVKAVLLKMKDSSQPADAVHDRGVLPHWMTLSRRQRRAAGIKAGGDASAGDSGHS